MAITGKQALDFLRSDDLIGLGMEADSVRRRLHPEGVVTYSLDCSLDVTGLMNADFHPLHDAIGAAVSTGCTAVRLQGGLASGLTIDSAVGLLRETRQRFPQIRLHAFTAPEILALTASANLALHDTLTRLHDAGLDSISGAGVDLLNGKIGGQHRPLCCTTEDWLRVHRTAHQIGMRTPAVMFFGAGESLEQRVDYLEHIRSLQQETGGFTAFIPWNVQATTAAGRAEEATAVEYLKVLAVSRLYLDNIANVQSSWAAQGLKVLQMGLRFGGNDAGSVMPEESAARSTTEEELRRIIRDAGFKPVQRDALYRTMYLN